ncbi:MAG: endonuclease/exonuclease/phosphatase family protein [Bacteroidales bacterium]|nr:endonuclease/exonuclease/phosphatase family protein [Bacteroidales bacterium]
MTYNIAAYDSVSFPVSRQERLIELIKQEKPDIVCFQEMSFGTLKLIKPQLDSIYGPCEVLKGDNQMWRLMFYPHLPLRNFHRHKCEGEFDTSDLTDEEKRMIEQSQKQMNVMSAEFEMEPGKWVTVFSGHLRSSAYSTARRSMDEDASWLSGLNLYFRNYRVGKRIRDYEAENVRRFVDEASFEGKPVIVAGDLNDWSGSYCLKTLMGKDLKDAWKERGRCFGWTFFGWGLRLRLDHILYSDELELVDVRVIDTDISDHKPLMARFRI